MIFEENFIRNLLKCNQCNEKFNASDQPRSLPCGKIICSVCIIKIEQESINSKFDCICLKNHQIPEEGFGINDLAHQLMTSKAKATWRVKRYEKLKINLQKIATLSHDLNINFDNGFDKIKEHCNEQRGLVNMAIENKIQELNKINEANTFLNEKKAYLKQIQHNEEVITNFNKQAEHLQGELNKELNILKSKIFGKKLIRFNSNLEKIDSKIIGFIDYDSLMSPV